MAKPTRRPGALVPTGPRPTPPRALPAAERRAGLEVLPSEPCGNQAPKTGEATLLDEGRDLCPWRPRSRVLAAADEVRARRAVLAAYAAHPERFLQKPPEPPAPPPAVAIDRPGSALMEVRH